MTTLTLRECSTKIRNKTLTHTQIVEAHLEKVAKYNKDIQALRFVNDVNAKLAAASLDSQIAKGSSETLRKRLLGCVVSVKDHIEVEGLTRSDGSATSSPTVSASSNHLVQKLLNEGAICIGKGNMAEYGKSYFTENSIFGRTNNPFDLTRTPGGLSGGDAAAVSMGAASAALVGDAGGSVRIPANFCGLFGLLPTQGRYSEQSVGGPSHAISQLFKSYGVLAKSADDLLILDSVLNGFDSLDPRSAPYVPTEYFPKKKFAYFTKLRDVEADKEISASIEKSVKKLESLGYVGTEVAPSAIENCYEIFILLGGQAALILEDTLLASHGTPRDESKEGPLMKQLRKRIREELPPLTVENLLMAWNRIIELRVEAAKTFDQYDFALCPVAATLPVSHGTTQYKVNDATYYSQQVYQFSYSANVLALPSIAFPTGLTKNGLPLGLQIMGGRFRDRYLIDIVSKIALERLPEPFITRA